MNIATQKLFPYFTITGDPNNSVDMKKFINDVMLEIFNIPNEQSNTRAVRELTTNSIKFECSFMGLGTISGVLGSGGKISVEKLPDNNVVMDIKSGRMSYIYDNEELTEARQSGDTFIKCSNTIYLLTSYGSVQTVHGKEVVVATDSYGDLSKNLMDSFVFVRMDGETRPKFFKGVSGIGVFMEELKDSLVFPYLHEINHWSIKLLQH
jgi:hypothetical protein